jgi:hypothetical protein
MIRTRDGKKIGYSVREVRGNKRTYKLRYEISESKQDGSGVDEAEAELAADRRIVRLTGPIFRRMERPRTINDTLGSLLYRSEQCSAVVC